METDYFYTQILILKFLGVPVTEKFNVKQKIYIYIMYVAWFTYVMFVILECFIPKKFDDLVNDLLFATGYFVSIVEGGNILYNSKRLYNILKTFQSGIFLPNSKRGGDVEQIWMDGAVSFAKFQTNASVSLGFLSILACVAATYFTRGENDEMKLPFGAIVLTRYCPFGWVLVYQTIVFAFAILHFMAVGVFFTSILIVLRVQYKLFQNSIKVMIDNSKKNVEQETHSIINDVKQIPWKNLQRVTKDVLNYHVSIINLSNEIEDVFSLSNLAVFIGMSADFCFIIYQASTFDLREFSFLQCLVMLLTSMMPLWINSYWGNEIIVESLAVAESCYEVDFIGTDVRFQKALKLILQRSQRPVQLSLGKFASLSVVTMVGICKMSYSYFMLLYKMNEK